MCGVWLLEGFPNFSFCLIRVSRKSSSKFTLNNSFFELGLAEKSLGNKVAAKDAFEKAKKDRNWRKSAEFELDMLNKGF